MALRDHSPSLTSYKAIFLAPFHDTYGTPNIFEGTAGCERAEKQQVFFLGGVLYRGTGSVGEASPQLVP